MNNFRRRAESLQDNLAGEYVDLGLPSGVKWCNHNIGGTNPEDYGAYFSWGNVVGHNEGEGYNFNSTTYDGTPGKNLTANIAVGDTYDAARACLGTPWRMPTKENFQELYDNTDREWTTINGVNGWKFMKKTDHSVFVFFPAAGYYNDISLNYRGSGGYYWSSSYNDSSRAYSLFFSSSNVYPQVNYYRYYGFYVLKYYNNI